MKATMQITDESGNIIFNDNDFTLILLCSERQKSITELSKEMGIAQKNIIARLEKLEEQGIIKVNRLGKGKKTLISTIKNSKSKELIEKAKFRDSMDELVNSPGGLEKFKEFKEEIEKINSKK